MGLEVLLVGRLRPELGTSGRHDGLPVADLRHPDAVQDAVRELAGAGGAVFVTCQRTDVAEVRRLLALVSVALPEVAVALEPLPGPPLAVAVASALVGGSDAGPAHQLAAFDRLRTQLWSAVWLPSVARLSYPAPSLAQHALSWLPGSGYLAVYTDPPRVFRASKPPLPALRQLPPEAMMVSSEIRSPTWVSDEIRKLAHPTSSVQLSSWRTPADAFNVTQAAELALVPAALLEPGRLSDVHPATCRGCGREQPRTACPFCGMAVNDTPALTASSGGLSQ